MKISLIFHEKKTNKQTRSYKCNINEIQDKDLQQSRLICCKHWKNSLRLWEQTWNVSSTEHDSPINII
jgi:hypothetical protein